MAEYAFTTAWHVAAPRERVFEVLHDSERWPQWWRGLEGVVKLEDGYFRTCVNYDDRDRAYCLFVDVDAEPPIVRRDPSTLPNQEFKPR